ncbi:MAG: VWA domain-containing protein [Roseibacillus sp.]|jgi:Ca-activated chloride channel family protein|nr:VWA domain-containing protein [Roseibacillus sp.]
MTFDAPLAFLLLLLIPFLVWVRGFAAGGRRRASIRFSSTRGAARAGRSWRQKLSVLPLLLRVIAIALVVTALARPQKGLEQVRDSNEGIAIEMVVDRSGSMEQQMVFDGQRMNRLEVVKKVFAQFVLGNGEKLKGRPNDLIGLVSFAHYPESTCPLTLAHGTLPRFIETVQLPRTRDEDGTAIGDAIALAAAHLEKAEDEMKRQSPDRADSYELKSKVMILLTDGEQTRGERTPAEGAALAKEWGIKIYTIAVGGEAITRQNTILGAFFQAGRGRGADTGTLKSIANETGGKFYEAQNASALTAIYEEIDELERSKIQSLRFMDYKELFLPFALAALVVTVIEVLLSCTLFRKIP